MSARFVYVCLCVYCGYVFMGVHIVGFVYCCVYMFSVCVVAGVYVCLVCVCS